ncbi:hypothetical protein Leryth_015619 [Lithospermum erythrorhizon]|nr:hypothetical protein Leryth_015619 [Lithospermum erythrorhizon]
MRMHFLQLGIFTLFSICLNYHYANASVPFDASSLLAFKSKADLHNILDFSLMKTPDFCKWKFLQCQDSKVVHLVIENSGLGGTFAPNTLTKLDQLRVLSLKNTSLTGPIPDLSNLTNLKVLFLDHNYFSSSLPPSISTLHRLKTLDLSYNGLIGSIPTSLNNLDRLSYLRLDFNRFNGTLPPLNISTLKIFNVSHNNISGPIPITSTLSRFKKQAFLKNPLLCGEIIHKECNPTQPFFGPTPSTTLPAPPKPAALTQNAEVQNGVELNNAQRNMHKRKVIIVAISLSLFVAFALLIIFILGIKIRTKHKKGSSKYHSESMNLESTVASGGVNSEAVMIIEKESQELEEKVKRVQEDMHTTLNGKSGLLVFCASEPHVYTLDQLMRASAELLGKGTMGSTYKAVLDDRLIMGVKRLDGGRFGGVERDVFERHMESVGGLRHPNLVPLRAFFQAKEERLLVYDYQPNGSLFSLIHGAKSARSKPLHWTSCLKIAEDIAQGLSYIHQAWRLAHGNLKSTNVLLGPDFEACITDYCLSAVANNASGDEDPDNIAYRAPETRKSLNKQADSKSDVYSFGVLLIEILTGKLPSKHPYLVPDEMVDWVRSTRDEDDGEDNRFEMLLEVALACNVPSPEQRPTMWQVLKMIQEIKEAVTVDEDGEPDPHSTTS